MTAPCDICRRVHPGRCVPTDSRSVRMCLSLPGGVARLLRERVPWGERSTWVSELIDRELRKEAAT